jgi:hypothetical protein
MVLVLSVEAYEGTPSSNELTSWRSTLTSIRRDELSQTDRTPGHNLVLPLHRLLVMIIRSWMQGASILLDILIQDARTIIKVG